MRIATFKSQSVNNERHIISNIFLKDLIQNYKSLEKNKSFKNNKDVKIIYISNFLKLNTLEFNELIENPIINSLDTYSTKTGKNILKKSTKKASYLFFIIELNSNCTIKDGKIINNLVNKIIKKSKKTGISIGFNIKENQKYFANIMTSSKDLNDDIANILISNLYKTKYAKYSYIYDKVCEKLDKNFIINNYCDFRDNKCVANRDTDNIERDNGCCHSFIRNKSIGPSNSTEELTLCKHLGDDKRCTIKSISCKFFVCQYLKRKGVYFDILDNFLLHSIFNRKQLDVIHINFFKTEDEIVKKLITTEYNLMPHKLFILFKMHLIDNYWKKIPEKK